MKDNQQNDTTKSEFDEKLSRRERKALKKTEKQSTEVTDETNANNIRWVQIRMIPIWLRVILVLLLLIGVAIIGLQIGYGYIGDGKPSDVLKKETWLHIVDIIKGVESE